MARSNYTGDFMGVKMPRLNNFLVNSKFPAVAKSTNVVETDFVIPAHDIASGQTYSYTQNVTVGQGDILSCVITWLGVHIPASQWNIVEETYQGGVLMPTLEKGVLVERTSPTQARLVYYAFNQSPNSISEGQLTYKISIKAFRVP